MNCIDKDATRERGEQEHTDSLNKSRQTDILRGRERRRNMGPCLTFYALLCHRRLTHTHGAFHILEIDIQGSVIRAEATAS